MTTKVSNLFTINGVIDTNQSVMDNMQEIATACGSWVTYDTTQGKWAVVINQAGSSVKSFTDSNIIGNVNVRGTGIYELYNRSEINFPNKDILDQKDVISVSIPTADRFQNEIDNTLNFTSELVNNPVQAELLASRELKQSRVDKIIEFRTDFTAIGLTAGDLIDVTNSALGYTSKLFRIITISEDDASDGSIVLSITALEYDSDVYSTAGLERKYTELKNQIGSSCQNTVVQNSNEQAVSGRLATALGLVSLVNQLTGAVKYFPGRSGTLSGTTAAVITWTFSSPGEDLDIRARLISPFLNQNSVDDYLGWTGTGSGYYVDPWYPYDSTYEWPAGSPVIFWGGDNTGTGVEQVGIDLATIQGWYPNTRYIVVECRGNWFSTATTNPVNLTADLYKGGTFGITPPTFSVSGYQQKVAVTGLDRVVTSYSTDPSELGDLIGYFIYDTKTGQACILDSIEDLGVI